MEDTKKYIYDFRVDSRFVPSQWGTLLLCNNISHWLGASLESTLVFYHFSKLRRHRYMESITMEDKDLLILQSQYHGCWCPGDTRSQGISSHGIELVWRDYSDRRVNRADIIQSKEVPSGHLPTPHHHVMMRAHERPFHFIGPMDRESIDPRLLFQHKHVILPVKEIPLRR